MPVRRLRPEDAQLLRSIRLRALTDAPEAFGSTYERELAFTDELWEGRLHPDANPHFVDEGDDGTVLGLVAAIRPDGEPGVASLVAMWVAPDARGTGAADRLVQRVIDWADTESVHLIRLLVMEDNGRAERLYARHGFRRTGRGIPRDRDGLMEIEMDRPVAPHVRRARADEAARIATVFLRSRHASVPDIPPLVHSDDDVREYFASIVVPNFEVWVADANEEAVALLVLNDDWVEHLYTDPEWTGQGIGSNLLGLAKARCRDGLNLWAFQSNTKARRFYERHGFTAEAMTDGDNEEGAPDVRYRWSRH